MTASIELSNGNGIVVTETVLRYQRRWGRTQLTPYRIIAAITGA